MLPADILFLVLTYLSEIQLVTCMRVSRYWYQIAHTPQLLYINRNRHLTLHNVILQCCQFNHVLSFKLAIHQLSTMKIPPQINFYLLWNDCLNICCQHGHLSLFKRILTYVSAIRKSELIATARKYSHFNMVEILQKR